MKKSLTHSPEVSACKTEGQEGLHDGPTCPQPQLAGELERELHQAARRARRPAVAQPPASVVIEFAEPLGNGAASMPKIERVRCGNGGRL